MKVKNVMFTGFAAAILGGACGAADAAQYTLASQDYVEKQLQSKQNVLTAGEGIKIEGNEISASFETTDGQTVTMGDLVESVDTVAGQLAGLPEGKTVAEALAGKQATLENADVLETITSDDVASIGTTAAAVQGLTTDLAAVSGVANAASTAAGAAQDSVDALELIVTNETTGLGSKVSQATYDAHLESQKAIDDQQTADIASNKRAIDGLSGVDGAGFATLQGDVDALKSAVNDENGAVATKIAAAIATETERADAAYAPASLTGTVSGLAETVATKADASALNDYVTTTALSEAGYQTQSQVQAEIAGATIAESQVSGLTQALAGKQATIEDLDLIKAGATAGSTAVQPETLTSTLANYVTSEGLANEGFLKATTAADTYQEKGTYLSDTMTEKGTYLVKRAEDGSISYVSVDVVGENGNPVQF